MHVFGSGTRDYLTPYHALFRVMMSSSLAGLDDPTFLDFMISIPIVLTDRPERSMGYPAQAASSSCRARMSLDWSREHNLVLGLLLRKGPGSGCSYVLSVGSSGCCCFCLHEKPLLFHVRSRRSAWRAEYPLGLTCHNELVDVQIHGS